MEVTLNPASIWFKLVDEKRDKRRRLADYLIEVAHVADRLCLRWEQVVLDIEKEGQCTQGDPNHTFTSAISPLYNFIPYSTLSEYFLHLSSAMGSDFPQEMEPFIFHISRLLEQRNITRDTINMSLATMTNQFAFAKDNETLQIHKLHDLILAMRREASAIHVKARTFQVK